MRETTDAEHAGTPAATPAHTAGAMTLEGAPVEAKQFEVAWDASAAEKGGWSSFMAKEIDE